MPTVDIGKARQFIERSERAERERLHARFVVAWRDFERIVRLLAQEPAVVRIFQWGSLLHEETFGDRSDIDIAIEGPVGAETFFRLFGEAQALTAFSLDLVEMDKLDALHAESIRRKGRLVYER